MEERTRERLMPEPEPPRKMRPSSTIQLRIESIESSMARMKQARALRPLLKADVEPDGRVEGRVLVEQQVLELGVERVGLVAVGEVAVLAAPRRDRVDDARDHLAHRALALRRSERPAEVLLRDDVRRRRRPEDRELHLALLEGGPVLAGDEGVAHLPLDLVVRVDARARVAPGDADRTCRIERDLRLVGRDRGRCLGGRQESIPSFDGALILSARGRPSEQVFARRHPAIRARAGTRPGSRTTGTRTRI